MYNIRNRYMLYSLTSIVVHLIKKIIKGKKYLYLEHSVRVDGKPQRAFSIYLGSEDKIQSKQTKLKQLLDGDYKISSYDFGLPVALMQLVERLDLINIIDGAAVKRDQGLSIGQYMCIATLNRCIQPVSKSKLKEWFVNTYLSRFFPTIDTYLDSMAYTNHFQYLNPETIDKIELRLIEKLKTEFHLNMEHLMYDPTNFHTFINPKEQELPKHGHSKQGRNTLNLVNVSIYCTRDGGVPLMHQCYPGNVQDASHFKAAYPKFLQRLKELDINPSEITLVFDKGNISKEVFKEIDQSGLHWISTVRPSSHKDLHQLHPKNFQDFTFPNGKEIGILEFERMMHQEKRLLIVSYDPNRAKWSKKNYMKKLEAKDQDIRRFEAEKLNVKKWRSLEKVRKKLKDILKSYHQYFDIEISGEYAQLSMSVKKNQEAIEKHIVSLGKGYYMTSRKDLSGSEIVWMYRQQYTIEKLFDYLKNPDMVRVMPMYHYKDESIRGHTFTCILALLLLTLLQREIRDEYPEFAIRQIIDLLSQIKLMEIEFTNGHKSKKSFATMSKNAQKLVKFYNFIKFLK